MGGLSSQESIPSPSGWCVGSLSRIAFSPPPAARWLSSDLLTHASGFSQITTGRRCIISCKANSLLPQRSHLHQQCIPTPTPTAPRPPKKSLRLHTISFTVMILPLLLLPLAQLLRLFLSLFAFFAMSPPSSSLGLFFLLPRDFYFALWFTLLRPVLRCVVHPVLFICLRYVRAVYTYIRSIYFIYLRLPSRLPSVSQNLEELVVYNELPEVANTQLPTS